MRPNGKQASLASSVRARLRAVRASFSSRSSRRTGIARCWRSAARVATRRSGSGRGFATSGGVCSPWSRIRPRSRPGGATWPRRGSRRPSSLLEGDAYADAAADRRRLRPRLPRRREGGLRAALPARSRQGRAGRARRRRQRALPSGDPGRLFAGPSGRSDPRERDGPARPRPRALHRPGLNGQCPPGRHVLPTIAYHAQRVKKRTCPVPGTRPGSLAYVLVEPLQFGYRGKEVVRLDRLQYGQWRYQRVEACPRDLRGIV